MYVHNSHPHPHTPTPTHTPVPSLCFFTSVSLYPSPYVLLRKSGEPQHLSFPWEMMAMRSPRRSASSMWCVDSRMVRPGGRKHMEMVRDEVVRTPTSNVLPVGLLEEDGP